MYTNSKKKIIEAALAVFSTKGFHQTSMDEIAKSAGVAKGTLYYNFPNKSKLFSIAVTEGLSEITHAIRSELDSDAPFIKHFHKLIEVIVFSHLKHANITKILLNELSLGIDKDALKEIESARIRYVDFITEILADGMNKGYLEIENPRLFAVALLGFLGNLFSYYLLNPKKVSRKQLVETTFSLLASGIVRK